MEEDRDGRGYTDRDADQVTGGDDHAVDEIMQSVPDQNHRRQGVRMLRASRLMAMPPMDEFLQNEKEKQPAQDIDGDSSVSPFHRFRNKMNERVPQKRSGRKTDQKDENLFESIFSQ